MDEWCKRSGQIPAFGNWDFANEMPITQYFECARQAGLVRYSSSSGESSDQCVRGGERDLYSLDLKKPPPRNNIPPSALKKGTRNRERRYTHGAHVNVVTKEKEKENGNTKKMVMRKQMLQQAGKVWDVTEQQRKQNYNNEYDGVPQSSPRRGARLPSRPPKPVDEDLYKIPPELLRTNKRKKMLGFISKCLVPAACVS